MQNGQTREEIDGGQREEAPPAVLIPAALDARVSSDRQEVDSSASGQIRALRDYAMPNGKAADSRGFESRRGCRRAEVARTKLVLRISGCACRPCPDGKSHAKGPAAVAEPRPDRHRIRARHGSDGRLPDRPVWVRRWMEAPVLFSARRTSLSRGWGLAGWTPRFPSRCRTPFPSGS